MKIVYKSYKFRLYPTVEQEVLLSKHFGCVRYVYNHFLNERITQYKEIKKSDNYNKQAATLTKLKKEEGTKWLYEVSNQALQESLRNLDIAYNKFFKKQTKFPRFKSRRDKQSFTNVQSNKLIGNKIHIPKFQEGIKVIAHREIKGDISKMNITKTPTGKYYVSIFTEQEIIEMPKTGKQVGIDLGIKDFVITSDNKKFKNNKYTKQYARKLKVAQQHLSRKKKGSKGHENQRFKVAKIHEKIASCRLDNLHKVSYQLVKENDLIVVEDLHVKGMIKNHKLSKHIADASWGNFVTLLDYKCAWYGKKLVRVNRFYPSSKTCNECGWINQKLKLSDREWTCINNHVLDRDFNAAKNILKEGLKISDLADLKIYGQELSITRVEEKSVFSNKAHPLKPETHSSPLGVGR